MSRVYNTGMFPELIDALKVHIKNNIPKDSLRLDTVNAGYSNEEFETAYAKANVVVEAELAALPKTTLVPVRPGFTAILPTDIVLTATAVPSVTSTVVETVAVPSSVNERRTKNPWLPRMAFLVLLLLLVSAAILLAARFTTLPTFLSSLFGRAPYAESVLLQDIARGASSITSAQFTFAIAATSAPLDADVYLLPDALKKELGDTTGILSLLPKEFSLTANVSGQFDTTTKLPETSTKIAGAYITPDFTANVDVELILSQDKGAFVRVNRMPSLFMLDLSAIRGQWVHIIEEPLTSLATNYASSSEADKAKRVAQLKLFLEYADKNQIFTLVGAPVAEKVGEMGAYKYTLVLNQVGLKTFFAELKPVLDAQYGVGGHFLSRLTPDTIAVFTSAAFVDYANIHTQYQVWAGSDGVPLQFEIVTRTAIDDDAKMTLFGTRMDENQSKRFALATPTLKYSLDSYKRSHAGSLKGFCQYQVERTQRIYPAWKLECTESATGYAMSLPLDQGTYCSDSAGYVGYGIITNSQTPLCTHMAAPVVPVVEAKPERQVNSSVKITLSHINEPVVITIPSDAMTREAANKLVPMLQYFSPGKKTSTFDVPTFPVGSIPTASASAAVRAADAGLKSKIINSRAQAEIYYTTKSSYKGFCLTPDAPKGVGVSCYDATDKYVVSTHLSTGRSYCVDSTGFSAELASSSLSQLKTTLKCPSVVLH